MKKTVKSPGSATIINAISTGNGSAFGINLHVIAEASLKSSAIKCTSKRLVDPLLMELCVDKVLKYHGLEQGIRIKTDSTLPVASGLSSSSATSNAVVLATSRLLEEEFELKPMSDMEILNLAIDASMEAGVTITGAFDDATASYFGGLTITNNLKREIIYRGKMENQNILIYMPDKQSLTALSDVNRMKLLAPWVDMAFKQTLRGQIYKALTLNGILYCAALGYDANIALDALDAGAIASGLSGTGPSFVAIVNELHLEKVQERWSSYPGEIIVTSIDNDGTQVI